MIQGNHLSSDYLIRLIPSSLTGRKDQLTFIINLIYVVTGIVFIGHDFYFDYLVDGYFSSGSIRIMT